MGAVALADAETVRRTVTPAHDAAMDVMARRPFGVRRWAMPGALITAHL